VSQFPVLLRQSRKEILSSQQPFFHGAATASRYNLCMISFAVRLKFGPEDRAEVVESLHALTLASRQEPGCVSYIPHHLEEDPDTVIIYEQYRDAKALADHRASEHFKLHAVGGLYQKMLQRSVENLIALA
jgi:quinol monooxygenase YgiN